MKTDRSRNAAPDTPPTDKPARRMVVLVSLLMLVGTIAAYQGVLQNDFVNFDDPAFVTANVHVKQGLSLDGARWALTELQTDYWHPLAWLSHMLDVSLFGMWAGGHHLTSLLLHGVNTLLLFGLLRYATGRLWPCAFVAGLFALHPLHVESAAWVAERKDVLCALFSLATMWMYVAYARKGGMLRYVGAVLLYAMSLMSKPMSVTVPVLLLVLDYWPLERFEPCWAKIRRLLLEKIPFCLMAAAVMVLTIIGQRNTQTLATMEELGLASRLKNAIVAYCSYIGQMFWPDGLAVLYPRHEAKLASVVVALVILVAVTVLVIRNWKRKYLVSGWLWYLVALIPVIGLVQVGAQSHADRYTYISLTGLSIMITWSLVGLLDRHPGLISAARVGGMVLLAAMGVLTLHQVSYWKNTATMASHSIAVTKDNYIMLRVLGQSQIATDQPQAMANLMESLRVGPQGGSPMTLAVIGRLLCEQGKYNEAMSYIDRALAIEPDLTYALVAKGLTAIGAGQFTQAEESLKRAIELDPLLPQAYAALAMAEGESGRLDDGIALYRRAVGLDAYLDDAWFNLAVLYRTKGDFRLAADAFARSASLRPTYESWLGLAGSLVALGSLQGAQVAYARAIELDPSQADAHYGLAVVLSGMGRKAEAAREAQKAASLAPGNTAVQELYRSLTTEP